MADPVSHAATTRASSHQAVVSVCVCVYVCVRGRYSECEYNEREAYDSESEAFDACVLDPACEGMVWSPPADDGSAVEEDPGVYYLCGTPIVANEGSGCVGVNLHQCGSNQQQDLVSLSSSLSPPPPPLRAICRCKATAARRPSCRRRRLVTCSAAPSVALICAAPHCGVRVYLFMRGAAMAALI